MGLKQWLGLGGPLSQRRIDGASKLACNSFAQPEVRMRELQRLLRDGSPAALTGALRRFTANAQGHIADEEEKLWLSGALVDLGDAARAPLEAYIRAGHKLTYALAAYRRIVSDSAAADLFAQVLLSIGAGDHRRIEAKQQLVLALAEDLDKPGILAAVVPFLADHADDVRWQVLDTLEAALSGGALDAQAQAVIMPQVTALLLDAHVSARIALRAATLVAGQEWRLPGQAQGLHPALTGRYFVDGAGQLRGRESA